MAAFLLILLVLLALISTAVNGGVDGGLSFELIHRRPLFGNASPEKSQSLITPDNSQFLMKIAIGTPPVDLYVILDTGSDLFWTQCLPCAKCYKQTNPTFDPSRSSSYRGISCQMPPCHWTGSGAVACSGGGACNYSYGYGGGLTEGNFASETMTVTSRNGEKVLFRNVVFGCGHNNSGGFQVNEMGLIGLGRGPASFISQIGPSVGGRKFSLCLMPFNTDPKISSTISIGSGSEVRGPGVITVGLVPIPDPTFYALTLTGISVGTTFLPYSSSGPPTKGNVILDSGTPPTLLPLDLYNRFADEVRRVIQLPPVGPGSFCYKNLGNFATARVSLHFDGGVELPLSTAQTFIRTIDGSFCFVAQGASGTTGIIGNFMQANFLIGYDIDQMTVSFKPTDCTKIG